VAGERREHGDVDGALSLIEKAHEVVPDSAELNNCLAWLLVLRARRTQQDATRAVELAKNAVGAAPSETRYWRTLGVAQHFAGNDKAAVEALTKSLAMRENGEAFDYFPLAAAHWQLGDRDDARKWYEKGVLWMARNKHPNVVELAVLRADVEARLGIASP
jgi:tetratricopeptide (TPR) repeat protein